MDNKKFLSKSENQYLGKTAILVKYPTRSRPQKFKDNLERYINTSSLKIKFIISMDVDDPLMNNLEIIDFLNSRQSDRIEIKYFYGNSKNKINAINRDIPLDNWDILIATADDMVPFPGWDTAIVNDFEGYYFRALNYNIDPRIEKQGKSFKELIVLPIIGRKLYDHFGYIYHPDYKSEYADNEQTEVFEKMGVIKHINKRPIIHEWDKNQDLLMRKNLQDGFSDRLTFEKRKSLNFPK